MHSRHLSPISLPLFFLVISERNNLYIYKKVVTFGWDDMYNFGEDTIGISTYTYTIWFDSIRFEWMHGQTCRSSTTNVTHFFLYCTLTNQLANHQVSSFELNVYKTKLEARCLFVWPKKKQKKKKNNRPWDKQMFRDR